MMNSLIHPQHLCRIDRHSNSSTGVKRTRLAATTMTSRMTSLQDAACNRRRSALLESVVSEGGQEATRTHIDLCWKSGPWGNG